MNDTNFQRLMHRVHATFGKKSPELTSDVMRIVMEKTSHVADSAVEHIENFICIQDKFPTNLTNAILAGYSSYLASKKVVTAECSECYDGYRRYYLPKNGRWFAFWSHCPKCNDKPKCRKMNDILAMGGIIMPIEYMERENEFLFSKGIAEVFNGRLYHYDKEFYSKEGSQGIKRVAA